MACEYSVCGMYPLYCMAWNTAYTVLYILRTYFWHELNVWILGCQVIPQLSAPTSNAKVETNFPIGRRPPFSLHTLSLIFALPSLPLLLLLSSYLLTPHLFLYLPLFPSPSPSLWFDFSLISSLSLFLFSFSIPSSPLFASFDSSPLPLIPPFLTVSYPFVFYLSFFFELSLCLSLSLHHSFSFILSYLSFWLHGIMRVCDTELVYNTITLYSTFPSNYVNSFHYPIFLPFVSSVCTVHVCKSARLCVLFMCDYIWVRQFTFICLSYYSTVIS
jgi:hypothetical protein